MSEHKKEKHTQLWQDLLGNYAKQLVAEAYEHAQNRRGRKKCQKQKKSYGTYKKACVSGAGIK